MTFVNHLCSSLLHPDNHRDFTDTSQSTLEVLLFPLSPPICKGVMHTQTKNTLAPTSLCKVEPPLYIKLGIPTLTSKTQSQKLFWYHNFINIPCLLSRLDHFIYRNFLIDTFPHAQLIKFLIE
jgi:hypothetical protein